MDKRLYSVWHCPVCGDALEDYMEDEVGYHEEYDDE